MVTVTVEEMQKRLPELLNDIKRGEDILITEDNQPFARLMPASPKEPEKRERQLGLQAGKIHFDEDQETTQEHPRQLGSGQNQVFYIAEDFNEPLELVESKELRRLEALEQKLLIANDVT